jgi:hypothetical protein
VMAQREGMLEGMLEAGLFMEGKGPSIRARYPLPTRTRQVLREEQVPGRETEFTVYRVMEGVLQSHALKHPHWANAYVPPDDFDLMRHALDLHDSPYLTEEVPADESDPWGEGDAQRRCTAQGCWGVCVGAEGCLIGKGVRY